jgi:hypothetical protein
MRGDPKQTTQTGFVEAFKEVTARAPGNGSHSATRFFKLSWA